MTTSNIVFFNNEQEYVFHNLLIKHHENRTHFMAPCSADCIVLTGAALLAAERGGWMGSLQRYGEPLVSNYSLTVPDALMYSSIASGVDAGAVLHIFEENGVNKDLFFVMLGESLLNGNKNTKYSIICSNRNKCDTLTYCIDISALDTVSADMSMPLPICVSDVVIEESVASLIGP
jgi:hypothetical protein